MIRAYFFGTGPGTVVPGGLHAFIKTRPELAVPDIEFMFRGAPADTHLWFPGIRPAYADGYGIRPTLAASRQPRRDPAALDRSARRRRASSTTSSPRRTICRACAKASSARATSPIRRRWSPIAARRLSPGSSVKTDAEIDAWLKRTAITAHHPCGTCAMGIGPDSGHRSGAAGARRRAPARGRCLGHARSRLGAYQRLRADDRGEGVRRHPRQAAAAGRSRCLR